jgi:putative nucleotidyltransferase with HDIG domain
MRGYFETMKKKILIVEDDNFFREALRDLLNKKYTVLEAPNGKTAKEVLSMQEVDIVLSDIQMPGLTGLELLEWSKAHKPVPFIIMTGFSMVLETKDAFELGAKGFIAKPFKNNELHAVIESVLPTEAPKFPVTNPNETRQEYCKVSIDEFVAKPKIDFDVYIKLSETKIIKIAYKGQEIQRDKVEHYKEKGVKYLYILREDFSKLVSFNLGLANLIKNRTDISSQKKLNFLKYTGEIILEKTFVEGIDKASYNDAKVYLEMTLDAVLESDENLEILSILNSHSDYIYAHSLGVSLFSVMIAKKLNMESETTLFKLSMAGLFHDIGKKEIDRTLLEKPRHLMTKEERSTVEGHVLRGQEILNSMPTIPSDVIQLVIEHHEDQEGLGFPFRKIKKDQHPMSKIIQCANLFIENTLANPSGANRSPMGSIAYLENVYGSRINPQCIEALKAVFSGAK